VKIFYGVQATGNGHITRARVLAPRLQEAGIEVTYLFSGRSWDHLFEMDLFGDYEWRRGLTFSTHRGRVQYIKTAYKNNLKQFYQDARSLDLSPYDIVITDFEPVTAWAAHLQNIKTLGVGHQYAFNYDIPLTGDDFLARKIMKHFAPASIGLGLHWHHFDQPILPPIIETPEEPETLQHHKIVVYLPFEEIHSIIHLLRRFKTFQFHVYSAFTTQEKPDHIHIKQLSRSGFQHDFRDCSGVICNAGFELASEALQMGKKLLVKPLRGQMEQLSNAMALEQIQLGAVMPDLDPTSVDFWLKHGKAVKVTYPDVAKAVVQWLLKGEWKIHNGWIKEVWEQVVYHDNSTEKAADKSIARAT
jgi:uncharacterized protein (TIGR00661 family)